MMTEEKKDILVLGIGNVLLGDEGVGVHATRILEGEGLSADVVDGGTGGFHLLSYLQDYRTIILIDATLDGQEPGTVTLRKPKYAKDFPRTLSAHDIGLKDLIESASVLNELPEIYLITVSIDYPQPVNLGLSEVAKASLEEVVSQTKEILKKIS